MKAPLRWLEEATPQEISEALLAVDEVKAVRVGAYLTQRVGPEAEHIIESAQRNLEEDPLGTTGRALIGLSRG